MNEPNEAKRKVIVNAQLTALLNRLKSGQPLTSQQMRFVEAAMGGEPKSGGADVPDEVASSASDLARKLGISRQIVSYHQGRDGAPKSLSLVEWVEYLRSRGKATAFQVPAKAKTASLTGKHDCGVVAVVWFNRLSESLLTILTTSAEEAGVKLSPKKADRLTWNSWLLLAELLDEHLVSTGHERFFLERDGEVDGELLQAEIPKAIRELAGRVVDAAT